MSEELYPVRVFFEGDRGCVKCPGLYRAISRAPVIPGLPKLTSIDFAPSVYAGALQPNMGERREMSAAEIQAVVAWLLAVQAGAA